MQQAIKPENNLLWGTGLQPTAIGFCVLQEAPQQREFLENQLQLRLYEIRDTRMSDQLSGHKLF